MNTIPKPVFIAIIVTGLLVPSFAAESTRSVIKNGATPDTATLSALSHKPEILFPESGVSKTLNYILYRNNIFIPVSVNDAKQCLFWVDTGGGTSFINSRHPDYKSLPGKSVKFHTVAVENEGKIVEDSAVFYLFSSLKFAGIELKNTLGQFFPSDGFDQTLFNEAGLEVCGMLGVTALSGMITEINYPQNTITFKPSGKMASASLSTAAKARLVADPARQNLSWVEISFNNGKHYDFDFDTGCSAAMRITGSLAEELGVKAENGYYSIPDGLLGDQPVVGVKAIDSRRSFNLLGYGFFRNFKMTLDYPGKTAYFEN